MSVHKDDVLDVLFETLVEELPETDQDDIERIAYSIVDKLSDLIDIFEDDDLEEEGEVLFEDDLLSDDED